MDETPAPPPPHQDDALRLVLGADVAGERLDRALAAAAGGAVSRERVKALIAAGAVTGPDGRPLTDGSARVGPSLAGGAVTIALPPPEPAAARPQAIPLSIVHEDAALIVIDKPAGMVVHPAAGNADGTLVNALLHHCRGSLSGIGGVARPGIVHRIDKDTSGLLVAAKTDAAHEGLARQFADHSIHRRYLAVVPGRPIPPAGRIEGAIGRSERDRKMMALVADGRGKHAVTHYETLAVAPDGSASLIACRLETGRTHQVRVHMASIGHPLLGDPVYARPPKGLAPLLRALGFARQALHAAELGFVHPVTARTMAFAAPLPPDMAELVDRLGIHH